jgi:Rod binding domain-containing protein
MITAPMDIVASMTQGPPLPARGGAEAFSQVLAQAARDHDRAVARDAASRLVSSVFVLPLLASMQDSPFQAPPFAPSFAEKQFQPLLNQHLADRITGAANFSLVDVIVDRLLGPESPPAAAPAAMENRHE